MVELDLVNSNVISLQSVSKQYGNETVVHNVNLNVQAGECVVLVGHNGAGKTTLMKLMLGLTRATSGTVEVLGGNPAFNAAVAQHKTLGYLPESVAFYEAMTGREVLRFYARLKDVSNLDCEKLLELVALIEWLVTLNYALKKLMTDVKAGKIDKSEHVVVISTAHGLKFPDFKVRYHEAQLGDIGVESRIRNHPVELDPENEDARINLQVLRLQREGKIRREIYEQLVREFPQSGLLWKALGEELGKEGNWSGAAAAYEEALGKSLRSSAIHLRLGAAYRKSGRLEEAIATYVDGIGKEPENIALYNNLTSAYAAAGRLDDAVGSCRRALEIDPENTRARDNWTRLKPFSEKGEKVDLTEE